MRKIRACVEYLMETRLPRENELGYNNEVRSGGEELGIKPPSGKTLYYAESITKTNESRQE